jgi:hypothetical protein
MSYIVKSDNFELGNKKKGDQVTEKELLDAGCNLEALVKGEHLSGNTPTKPATEIGADE